MNDQATICEQFIRTYNLSMTEAVQRESAAIYWTRRAKSEVISLESFATTMSIEAQMLRFVLMQPFAHAEGSLVALVTGLVNSAVVVARAATEHAISVLYILESDQKRRLIQYLSSPMRKERERLDKLRRSGYSKTFDPEYFAGLTRTCDVLEEFVKSLAKEMGVEQSSKDWPNISTLFERSPLYL